MENIACLTRLWFYLFCWCSSITLHSYSTEFEYTLTLTLCNSISIFHPYDPYCLTVPCTYTFILSTETLHLAANAGSAVEGEDGIDPQEGRRGCIFLQLAASIQAAACWAVQETSKDRQLACRWQRSCILALAGSTLENRIICHLLLNCGCCHSYHGTLTMGIPIPFWPWYMWLCLVIWGCEHWAATELTSHCQLSLPHPTSWQLYVVAAKGSAFMWWGQDMLAVSQWQWAWKNMSL